MKLKAEVVIDADSATVWRYFDNADNLRKWQPTLRSHTLESGTAGEPDAISELVYEENGRTNVVKETITARRKPDFLAGTRESASGNAVVANQFEDEGENETRWVAYWNLSFKGATKVKALFTHKSIRQRIEDEMARFKLLVETGESST